MTSPVNHALLVIKTYLAIPISSAIVHDSVEKISPMRMSGRGSIEEMVVRMVGIVSRIMAQIFVTTLASGETMEEMSAAGIWMTGRWMSAVKELRSWDSAVEVVVVTARTVTWRLWWLIRRRPSNNTGTKWPTPGLHNIAA